MFSLRTECLFRMATAWIIDDPYHKDIHTSGIYPYFMIWLSWNVLSGVETNSCPLVYGWFYLCSSYHIGGRYMDIYPILSSQTGFFFSKLFWILEKSLHDPCPPVQSWWNYKWPQNPALLLVYSLLWHCIVELMTSCRRKHEAIPYPHPLPNNTTPPLTLHKMHTCACRQHNARFNA